MWERPLAAIDDIGGLDSSKEFDRQSLGDQCLGDIYGHPKYVKD
jgi:hypothetical protein